MSAGRRGVVLKVRQWIERGKEDLRLANHAMTMKAAVPYRLVAYHAQQCAEKCLKAYLVAGMTDFPYTHNLGALLELCSRTASWVTEVQDAETLSSYAVTARYPGGPDHVSKREALFAVAVAGRVLKKVTADLKERKLL